MPQENHHCPVTIVSGCENDKARFSVTGVQLAAEPIPAQPGFRIVSVSFLSARVGLIAGCIAFLLYRLIGLFTSVSFYGRFSADLVSPRFNRLGPWVILVPVAGGLMVGVMAKYGSPKIKGHGIPEAMETVLANRSKDSAAGSHSQAAFARDRDRLRRALRC
jgi:hypothetical protein